MSATIALVGRPNVGKSTLYNRMVGGRPALVHDTPGLTRDRRYGEFDYFGRVVRVIDTGGLDPAAEGDVIGRGIHRQAWRAIDEADALVLVVDGAAGLAPLDAEVASIIRATGKPIAVNTPPTIVFESARAFGDVWALTELWHELGFDQLQRVFRRTRHEIDVEALLRIMVFNRLCDPESKLGVLRWLETVTLPGLALKSVSHHQLLRAMDALLDLSLIHISEPTRPY